MAEEKESSRRRDASGRYVSKAEAEGDEPAAEGDTPQAHEGEWVEDISDTIAPSIGPGSVVVHHPHPEAHPSDLDAMGHDTRRQVVGKTYGPTLARQAALYGIFLVVAVAIAFGIKVAVDHFDQPPKHFAAEAPWAQKGVKQIPPKPLQ